MSEVKRWHQPSTEPLFYINERNVFEYAPEAPFVLASDYDALENRMADERIAFWDKISDQDKALENRNKRIEVLTADRDALKARLEEAHTHMRHQLICHKVDTPNGTTGFMVTGGDPWKAPNCVCGLDAYLKSIK